MSPFPFQTGTVTEVCQTSGVRPSATILLNRVANHMDPRSPSSFQTSAELCPVLLLVAFSQFPNDSA
ncbi:hypothetical protein NECAME_07151 [Necator americanus]|uniref:Uncharacterized protein n=1 Tax=Necator americanus TaxID=51031 RepID=W2TQB7_NECAM|nr:hypothetical protein NECAME_07151 [Necator americanus]ETN83859.1 hypothetical protein NECAME_07151 [Necator americanus]